MFITVGVFSVEGPPVPIPNTEVKLYSGDNTCLETDREDSSAPTLQLVILTQRVHPFPFRTRKLSSAVATILYERLYGKIAQCRHLRTREEKSSPELKKNQVCESHTNHIGS